MGIKKIKIVKSKIEKGLRMNLCSFMIEKYDLTGCIIHQMDKDSDEFIQLFITSDELPSSDSYLDLCIDMEKEVRKYLSYNIGYEWTENIDVTTIDSFINPLV